jgi:rhamnosyltransferase
MTAVKIIGVVVIYKPDIDLLKNINTYLFGLDKLLVVDNSPCEQYAAIFEGCDKKIKYMACYSNIGIASAYNLGAEYAIDNAADWLLTMDQDSRFTDNAFSELVNLIKTKNGVHKVGIISPSHSQKRSRNMILEPTVVMSSGNFVNLKALSDVGGFEDKLFIDAVDYDFCLKLRSAGYKIIECGYASLNHKLGETRVKILFGKALNFHVHTPLRRYYMTRNALFYWKKHFHKHPLFVVREILNFPRNFLEILLFSSAKKSEIKCMLRGVGDFFANKYGKYIE